MLPSFDKRSHQLERLDTGDYTPEEYARWQREAPLINRFLGDTRALRIALKKELREMTPGPVSILDVGAGTGELLKAAGSIVRLRPTGPFRHVRFLDHRKSRPPCRHTPCAVVQAAPAVLSC